MSTTAPNSLPPSPDFGVDYVQLPITSDEQSLADGAVATLQATWPDWEPNDGDMEVVLIETLATIAADATQQASNMPPAALIALGQLIGVPYSEGVQATTTVTLTFIDDAGGYFVEAGSEVEIGGYAFDTVADVTSASGSDTVAGVQVICAVAGQAANGLSTADGWASISLPVWVTDLATDAPTSDGVDPIDDQAYLDLVSRELQLRARVVVTLADYELIALDQPGVARAYAETTAARDVSIYLTGPDGEPVPTPIKTALAAIYATKRLVNVTVSILDANYTTIDVGWAAQAAVGFDPSDVQARGNAALAQLLSPAGWGIPTGVSTEGFAPWDSDNVVRVNKIIATLGSLPGLDFVVGTPTINGVAADFTMTGPVALPQPGTMTGTVSSP
jgi:hypothetical protein